MILYYSDTQTDLVTFAKALKASLNNILIKLILINKDPKLLKGFLTLAKLANIIIIRLNQISKKALELPKLALSLAIKYKFILITIIGNDYLQHESYNYSTIPNGIIDGLWHCYLLNRVQQLTKCLHRLIYNKNEIKIEEKSEPTLIRTLKLNTVPLQNQDNTVLIYCYGIDGTDDFIKQITRRLILARLRPIILCNRGQLHSN